MSTMLGSGGETTDQAVLRRIPTWLVSTPHVRRVLRDGVQERVPYGVRHARQIGSSTSACGMVAFTWVNFYGLAFVAGAGDSCVACSEAVSGGQVRGGSATAS